MNNNSKPVWCWVCNETGLYASDNCMNMTFKAFIPSQLPKGYCPARKPYECGDIAKKMGLYKNYEKETK